MKKERDSNMELLRITAMFLVLIVHVDFFSIGAPSAEDCFNNTLDASLRVLFETISIACVDIFICISGWFGIRPSAKGLCNFIFQCLFWLIGLYVLTILLGISKISIEGIKGCFVLTKLNWFIKAYFLLYILAPVLNVFAENAPQILYRNVLIGFFIFEFIFGWAFAESTKHIQNGFSTISFIGLYMLSRYFRLYRPVFAQQSPKFYVTYLVISSICVISAYIIPPLLGIPTVKLGSIWIGYITPYCIFFSMSMILLYSKMKIQSKFVNWVAASSFAVFLIHTNPNTLYHFKDLFIGLYKNTNCIEFWIFALCILVIIFIIAIIIDQVRITLWNLLWKQIKNRLT